MSEFQASQTSLEPPFTPVIFEENQDACIEEKQTAA